MAKLDPQWRQPGVLEAIFDQLSDALLLYDRDRRITGANRAAERLLGISAEELVGKECREVFGCSECDPICGVLLSIGDLKRVAPAAVRLQLPNGLERTVIIRTTQILAENGQLDGVAATIQDVTAEYEPHRRQIIADSPLMADLMRFVRRVAMSEATTVLLEGENGVGKDLIAATLHSLSPRQAEPFIAINCAAIPETLLESELFGYERGAFTDAKQQKRGLFELADNGTLFLDEIGDIPLMVQAKLLRVLEDQQFRRLGGTKDLRLNLRFVAATNKNLREAVEEGAFRQDLYFRLNVIQITIPPLRERTEDILPLARFFIDHYNRRFKRAVEGVSDEAAALLLDYPWPGNVRELRNAIERAMILEEGTLISAVNLPIAILVRDTGGLGGANAGKPNGRASERSDYGFPESVPRLDPRTVDSLEVPRNCVETAANQGGRPGAEAPLSLEASEIELIRSALKQTNGNQTHAAKLLAITRDTLRYKIKKHGL